MYRLGNFENRKGISEILTKPIAQQRFASMATSGFSYGKSAAEWNVLLYL